MQKFSGIYMGRHRRQAGEPEADMEGSGEDNEPQVLATLAQELRQSILQIESKLVTHLQENQEASPRSQSELRETVEKVTANRDLISQVLLDLTHGGKGPEKYANTEASGSHGGNRQQQEHIPYYHTEGQSHGGGAA
jgi:hypothetical protein